MSKLDGAQTARLEAATQQGTAAAYELYQPELLRFVRRLAARYSLSDAQLDAEGVVHETFVAAMRHWSTIVDPPAWLFTVARRMVGRASKKAQRYAGEPVEFDQLQARAVLWKSTASRPTPADVYAAGQVVAVIQTLTPRQRTATYLRHALGWSGQEIADLLDCQTKTADVHVHRGTKAARAVVERHWDDTRYEMTSTDVAEDELPPAAPYREGAVLIWLNPGPRRWLPSGQRKFGKILRIATIIAQVINVIELLRL